MYRGEEPAFCRGCGTRWTPGRSECTRCGEPAKARAVGDDFGRALPTFTPQGRLVWALTGLTVVYAIVLVVELLAGRAEHDALEALVRGGLYPSPLEAIGRRELATMISAVSYLGVIVAFGVWVVRAGRNLRARGILDTRDIDEARILWFFVPVVHLYRPLLGLRELWQGSRTEDPAHWRMTSVPVVLWIWWPVWLLSNGLGNASLWTAYGAESPQGLLLSNELDLWRAITRLCCVPLFLAVVWGIERAQAQAQAR